MTETGQGAVLLQSGPEQSESQLPTTETPNARFYRPELDVARFCAFLLVFLGHAVDPTPASPLWLKLVNCLPGLGVPLFFALSAYLVTELLLREKRLTGAVNVSFFYGRRILRIWPLYFALLGLGFVVSRVYHGEVITVFALVSYLLLLGNWYTSRYGYLSFGLSGLWSISIEEQFYLSWPWILRIASVRTIALISFAGWICSQASLWYFCSTRDLNNPAEWTNTLVQMQYFAIGVGICLFLNGSLPRMRGWVRVLVIISGFLLYPAAELLFNASAVRALDQRSSVAHTFPVYLVGDVSVLVILIGFLGCSSLQSWSRIRYLGKISYGLYLFHPMAIGIAQNIHPQWTRNSPFVTVVALSLSTGIAWMSYDYLEKPFMRMKDRLAIVKSRGV